MYICIKHTFINLFIISVISGYSFSQNRSLVILKQIFSYIVAVNWNLLQSKWHIFVTFYTVNVTQEWHITPNQIDTVEKYFTQSKWYNCDILKFINTVNMTQEWHFYTVKVTQKWHTIKVTQSWNITVKVTGIDKVVKYCGTIHTVKVSKSWTIST